MLNFLSRVAAKVAPFLPAVARIMFAEGRTELERAIQTGLRMVTEALLTRRVIV